MNLKNPEIWIFKVRILIILFDSSLHPPIPMINFFFSSKKQLFSMSKSHSPNLGPLLGLGFRVWRLGSRNKGLAPRV